MSAVDDLPQNTMTDTEQLSPTIPNDEAIWGAFRGRGTDPKSIKKLCTWFRKGILNDLRPSAVLEALLAKTGARTPKSKGQYITLVGTLIGYIDADVLGVTEDFKRRLYDEFHGLAAYVQAPYDAARAQGRLSDAEMRAWHDWDDLRSKVLAHYESTKVVLRDPLGSRSDLAAFSTVVFLLGLMLMPNTRSALLDVKVSGYDPENDNYILFSGYSDYRQAVIVWNKRKRGTAKRFNYTRHIQQIPIDYVRILWDYNAYWSSRKPSRQFLLVNTRGDPLGAALTQKNIFKLTDRLVGKRIGLRLLRPMQVTAMGLPSTDQALTLLARDFHHAADQHRLYFREGNPPVDDDGSYVEDDGSVGEGSGEE